MLSELNVNRPHDYDYFVEQAGFQPLDEPDITYFDLQAVPGLEEDVKQALSESKFISIIDNDENSDLVISFGWHTVNVLHRCFIPDESAPPL